MPPNRSGHPGGAVAPLDSTRGSGGLRAGIVLLGEAFTVFTAVGGALIVAGLVVTVRRAAT